eukprot:Em0018g423a
MRSLRIVHTKGSHVRRGGREGRAWCSDLGKAIRRQNRIFCRLVGCCALATPEFEGREGEELGSHLAHELLKAYSNSGCLDLSSLAVIPGQQCWVLYVDALVLEWGGGGVLESLSVAVVAALKVTRIPRLIISGEGEDMEFEVSDNPHDVVKLDVKGAPVIITLSQIGNHFLVDASMQEELCASARLFVAINSSQNIVSISKDGFGGLLYNKLQDVILVSGGSVRVEQ